MLLAKKQSHRPQNRIENQEINSYRSKQIIFQQRKIHNGEKKAPSINGAGKIGKPQAK